MLLGGGRASAGHADEILHLDDSNVDVLIDLYVRTNIIDLTSHSHRPDSLSLALATAVGVTWSVDLGRAWSHRRERASLTTASPELSLG